MQFGWTEDYNGFVLGDQEYRRDGTIVKTAISPYVKELGKLFKPAGSYDKWKEAAQLLNNPSLETSADLDLGDRHIKHIDEPAVLLKNCNGSMNAWVNP